MRLGICSRSGDIIEPYLCPQWYVNCNTMAARAVEAVRKGKSKSGDASESVVIMVVGAVAEAIVVIFMLWCQE